MSDTPTFSSSTPRGLLTPRRLARMAILIALSGVGALVKIPSPTGTVGLDSAPGFLAAAIFSPAEGAIVAALGHLLTAATAGFSLGVVIHLIVAAMMAGFAWVFAFLVRRVQVVVAVVVTVLLNGLAAPLVMIPVAGWGGYLAMIVPLLVSSAANAAVAVGAGSALSAAGLADHPLSRRR